MKIGKRWDSMTKKTLSFFLIFLTLSFFTTIYFNQSQVFAAMTQRTVPDCQPNLNFSIMQITDTQMLSAYNPTAYENLCNWIVNYSAVGSNNLQMVIHTGDIVNNGNDRTQWQNANNAMMILSDNNIPYCWDVGNHDEIPSNAPQSNWYGNQYSAFSPTNFENKSYYVSDYYVGMNTAVQFQVGNYKFLIINLEYLATQDELNWVSNLLDTHTDYNIILATHYYINWQGALDPQDSITWPENLSNLLNNYPNVFMTLNGHDYDDTQFTDTAGHNFAQNGRAQIEWDWQAYDSFQGAESARIYTFNLTSKTITANTYDVASGGWVADSGNSFNFTSNLFSSTNPAASISPTSIRMDLGEPQTFDSSVLGGSPPYAYQWCRNSTVVMGATSANWTFTPTQSGNYNIYLNVTDSLNNQTQSNVVDDIVVYSQPLASISPISTKITIGGVQQLNAAITGGLAPYTYQWYYTNGTAISGAKTSTLTYKANFTGTYNIYLNATDNLNNQVQSNNATIRIGSTNIIAGFVVQSGGSDYTTPVVIISGGGGTGATAVARVSQGVIFGIVLTNPGSGFTSVPTIVFRDPNPRAQGATATVVFNFS